VRPAARLWVQPPALNAYVLPPVMALALAGPQDSKPLKSGHRATGVRAHPQAVQELSAASRRAASAMTPGRLQNAKRTSVGAASLSS
jgi:hypothetical protein